jgi:hypothetical protein
VLDGLGKVSHDDAVLLAEGEYEKYKKKTDAELTQVERDFLETIRRTYEQLEHKKPLPVKPPEKKK